MRRYQGQDRHEECLSALHPGSNGLLPLESVRVYRPSDPMAQGKGWFTPPAAAGYDASMLVVARLVPRCPCSVALMLLGRHTPPILRGGGIPYRLCRYLGAQPYQKNSKNPPMTAHVERSLLGPVSDHPRFSVFRIHRLPGGDEFVHQISYRIPGLGNFCGSHNCNTFSIPCRTNDNDFGISR